jgi:general nucleoside transport system ATP-binding protein
VRHGGQGQPLKSLSGGNAQKLIAARELSGYPSFVLADQPTRGIDVATAAALHNMLIEAASTGAAVLVISADLDELLRLCDRIVVLAGGRIALDTVNDASLGIEKIGRAMLGVDRDAAA